MENHCQALYCLATARNGFDTCAEHKDYFLEHIWCDRFLWKESNSILCNYEPSTSQQEILYKHVVETIRSRRVSVGKSEIARIPANNSHIILFIVLLREGLAHTAWNKELFNLVISYYIIYRSFGFIQQPLHLFIPGIAEEPNYFVDTLLNIFGYSDKQVLEEQNFQPNTFNIPMDTFVITIQETIVTILQELIDQTNLRYISFADTRYLQNCLLFAARVDKYAENEPVVVFINTRILPLLKAQYLVCKQFLRQYRDPIKEELVMNYWHPNRVAKMLEMYGDNFDDYI